MKIGIDVGKKVCVACIKDPDGKVLERAKYRNTRADADAFVATMIRRYGEVEATCEATANMWLKTYRAFAKRGVRFVLANPGKLKLRYGTKSDKIDAETLSELLRLNAIPPSHVYSEDSRTSLTLLRYRIRLVQMRSGVIASQHNMLDKYDHTLSSCGSSNMWGPKCLQFIKEQKYDDPADSHVIASQGRHIEFLNQEIRSVEEQIRKRAADSRDAQLLMSMPGLDYFGALLISTAIDGVERFGKSKKLISLVGLCPKTYQSGDSVRYGRMKKDVDGVLTWVMMEAAMTAVRHDTRLEAIYTRKCKTHPPIVARSHVAKTMIIIAYHILKTGEPYEFRNEKTYQRKLARLKR